VQLFYSKLYELEHSAYTLTTNSNFTMYYIE